VKKIEDLEDALITWIGQAYANASKEQATVRDSWRVQQILHTNYSLVFCSKYEIIIKLHVPTREHYSGGPKYS
jgi:hypothetical protein